MKATFESIELRPGPSPDSMPSWFIGMTHVFEAGDVIPGGGIAEGGETQECFITFPTDTLEWRAAEYGLPVDMNLLWDVVISEMYMGPEDYENEPELYKHPDRLASQKAHLARAARVKWRHRLSTRTNHEVHVRVKRESNMHPEALAIKAGVSKIAHEREMERLNRPSMTEEARVRDLSKILRGSYGDQVFQSVRGTLPVDRAVDGG